MTQGPYRTNAKPFERPLRSDESTLFDYGLLTLLACTIIFAVADTDDRGHHIATIFTFLAVLVHLSKHDYFGDL